MTILIMQLVVIDIGQQPKTHLTQSEMKITKDEKTITVVRSCVAVAASFVGTTNHHLPCDLSMSLQC